MTITPTRIEIGPMTGERVWPCFPRMWEFKMWRLKLTAYRGSPWIGFELMRRCLFVTLFGRRFEFRVLKK